MNHMAEIIQLVLIELEKITGKDPKGTFASGSSNNIAFSKCDLQADIGFDNYQLTLKLTLKYNGKNVGSQDSWFPDTIAFFEQIIRKIILQDNNLKNIPVYVYPSDYLIVRSKCTNIESSSNIILPSSDTCSRNLRKIRNEVYSFAKKYCNMIDANKKVIHKNKFMLEHYTPRHIIQRIGDLPITKNDQKKRTESKDMQIFFPCYKFRFWGGDRQIELESNIFAEYRKIKEVAKNMASDTCVLDELRGELFKILGKSIYCYPAWITLIGLAQRKFDLADQKRDFNIIHKVMCIMADEKDIYSNILRAKNAKGKDTYKEWEDFINNCQTKESDLKKYITDLGGWYYDEFLDYLSKCLKNNYDQTLREISSRYPNYKKKTIDEQKEIFLEQVGSNDTLSNYLVEFHNVKSKDSLAREDRLKSILKEAYDSLEELSDDVKKSNIIKFL